MAVGSLTGHYGTKTSYHTPPCRESRRHVREMAGLGLLDPPSELKGFRLHGDPKPFETRPEVEAPLITRGRQIHFEY